MGNVQTSNYAMFEEEFRSDPRWQLLERILLSEPFQKSNRLPNLLRYLAECSIRGHSGGLTEQKIGVAVLGKPPGYSPAEDSAVRVHVRQLRLRLHEYFACDGRDETLVVDIPKGSYELVFQDVHPKHSLPDPTLTVSTLEPSGPRFRIQGIFFWGALALALVCGFGWYRSAKSSWNARVPWPVSAVIQDGQQTKVVVSDGSLMLRLMTQHKFSLEDYLKPGFIEPGFLANTTPPHMDENVSRLVKYISSSQITAFADTEMASTLVKLAGPHGNNLIICTARNLNRQNLDQGNFVFVGGPTSNPWASLFADKLNFETVEDTVGGRMYFRNKKPKPGEKPFYEGLKYVGSDGEDYATISLLPSGGGQGTVMLLQGLREEGTEALSIFLASSTDRRKLRQALNLRENAPHPVYFEALVRARTVAGAPVSINIVATRIISP